MAVGKLVKAYRYLFSRAEEDSKTGFLVPSRGPGSTAIKPLDFRAQINAFKGTVYSCIDYRSTAVASTPLRFYVAKARRDRTFRYTATREVSKEKKDYLFSLSSNQRVLRSAVDLEEVVDHPVIDLLANVNNIQNEFDLKQLTEVFLSLCGNTYWYMPKNGLGKPAEVWVIPSQYMSVVTGEGGHICGYMYRKGLQKVVYDKDEIIHFKIPSPYSIHYGLSPLAAVSAACNLQDGINKLEQAGVDNGARPSVALSFDEGITVTDDTVEQAQKDWAVSYGAQGKNGIPFIAKGFELKEFGWSPREMQYLQGRLWTETQIAGAYKIPLSFLREERSTLGGGAKGSPSERRFAKYAVLPETIRISQELNQSLCPLFNDRLFSSFDSPVPEDLEFKLKALEIHLKTGYSLINEERKEEGKEPLPHGNEPFAMPRGNNSASNDEGVETYARETI